MFFDDSIPLFPIMFVGNSIVPLLTLKVISYEAGYEVGVYWCVIVKFVFAPE